MAAEVLPGPLQAARFPAGQRHFVFEAIAGDGAAVVVRASRREDVAVVRDALAWSELLRPLGIPLPEVLHADLSLQRHPFPYVLLERLPGRDLAFVVGRLSRDDLTRLARRLFDLQAVVSSLPAGRGYGFAPRLDGPFPQASWQETVTASLMRSRKRIRTAGVVSEAPADRVEAACEGLTGYFAAVPPRPFLHDITTKNVIIDGMSLSGIVDVDDLCFGDPLILVGLIRVALLANGHGPAYADAWVELLRPDEAARAALDFYTALFCLDFLGELGHGFNRAEPEPVAEAYVKRLQTLIEQHSARR